LLLATKICRINVNVATSDGIVLVNRPIARPIKMAVGDHDNSRRVFRLRPGFEDNVNRQISAPGTLLDLVSRSTLF